MYRIMKTHPELKPYESDINLRMKLYDEKKKVLVPDGKKLADFANAHHYFGFHVTPEGWYYREWAPAADRVYLTGDFNDWHWLDTPLTRLENGVWEVFLPGETLHQGSRVRTIVDNGGRLTEHIPLYARRVVQNPENKNWCCEVWDNVEPYPWTDADFHNTEKPLIYEAHVGMSSEDQRVASYLEFRDNMLPRIKADGYNTVQLMAIMEHPYYGSFGYQVSNFYAASSRFGYPEELKSLVDTAHAMGLRVLLDVVHSHAVKNTLEGINLFDGTTWQFFHDGPQGEHVAWGTKCFNYAKPEVIHFLLSNLKFWMEEYHFDGFRFDGVTSMLYHDHALGSDFDCMDKYFTMNTDTDAVTYLQLASEVVHQVNPEALCIAEDMSGMPGMTEPIEDGGIGFDFRLGMGNPDLWTRLVVDQRDEDWSMDRIWNNMVFRNAHTIAYVECHDQALQGAKTNIFRLADAAMYTDMEATTHTDVIDRAMALNKIIRLTTISSGGDGYLNFMGNEFGHPEWIDFPREGNGWSYYYCRRQWSLESNPLLKYSQLAAFDKAIVHMVTDYNLYDKMWPDLCLIHDADKIIAYERGGLVFVFNYHPFHSYDGYAIPVQKEGKYEVLFTTDDWEFGGYGRIARMTHETLKITEPAPEEPAAAGKKAAPKKEIEKTCLKLYLPARTAMVLKKL